MVIFLSFSIRYFLPLLQDYATLLGHKMGVSWVHGLVNRMPFYFSTRFLLNAYKTQNNKLSVSQTSELGRDHQAKLQTKRPRTENLMLTLITTSTFSKLSLENSWRIDRAVAIAVYFQSKLFIEGDYRIFFSSFL